MILNDTPVNEAVLSNVGEIGEFRIRNSAKAFNILSSGLYANKIRAVIRELSCNAVDSHAASGKKDTPFDVHLPNSLEPWFAIRDYGTGLSHDQVTQIYTTYFESTKTNSNEFIGALGLGSKSPFSYTDNFTVTAIRDGVKGIYSAFINGSGVPSIALMMSEDTTEPAGVEVKFSVNDRYDFEKFRQEAVVVYTYFALRPVVSGSSEFVFKDVEYIDRDIIPGVHSTDSRRNSVAVMGNIAYPIDVPNHADNLGELARLLSCGLEMHFGIGELDFQASREGLSYIPQTIASIKSKLEQVNAVLAGRIADEAEAIDNLWERALLLKRKNEQPLWGAAVRKYISDTEFAMFENPTATSGYLRLVTFRPAITELAAKFNLVARGFSKARGQVGAQNRRSQTHYGELDAVTGVRETWQYWEINTSALEYFVINDTKTGALERAKFHWRNSKDVNTGGWSSDSITVLEPADRSKPVDTVGFFESISNPPKNQILMASALLSRERADSATGKNVTILKLEERGNGGYYRAKEMVWRDAGKVDSYDASQTYYYLPLNGFMLQSIGGYTGGKELFDDLSESGLGIAPHTVYGVRKTDIEDVKKRKNWVNLETHIVDALGKVDEQRLLKMALNSIDKDEYLHYNARVLYHIDNVDSPYTKFLSQFKDVKKVKYSRQALQTLCQRYKTKLATDPDQVLAKLLATAEEIKQRYPLLEFLTSSSRKGDYDKAVGEYISMIDSKLATV
jgi:hypothetical protein